MTDQRMIRRLCLLLTLCLGTTTVRADEPNIVLILADDMGAERTVSGEEQTRNVWRFRHASRSALKAGNVLGS